MDNRNNLALVLMCLFLVLTGCSKGEPNGCTLPPTGFSSADLIGTWTAVGSQGNNAIILREDGKYKQILSIHEKGFSYESDWQPWRLEYATNKVPYVHLEGLLMCAYWDEMKCEDRGVGEDYWRDLCQEQWVHTPGEAVLIVLGVNAQFKQPARGIQLVPFTKSADGTTGPTFELQKP